MFIEHLGKNTQNSGFVFVDRALGIDVEKNGVRRNRCTVFNLCEHHGIIKLISKVFDGMFSGNHFIGKQIREHLQEVRFTASEEAGNPYTDFICRNRQGFLIVGEECIEMFTQFTSNDVFTKFLLNTSLIILRNFDNTVNVTVYIRFIDVL